jgi:hypothetical protein
MLHHVALVSTDVSEELGASFITVTRIGELGTTLAVTSNRSTLRCIVVPSSTELACYTVAHTSTIFGVVTEDFLGEVSDT